MKKVVILAAVVAALASCQSRANKAVEAQADSLALAMIPTIELTKVYEGTLLATDGPGTDYVPTLNTATDGVDTAYTPDMTHPDAEGQGQNKTFTSKGKQQIVHKIMNKKPVTAVKLTPKDGETPMYSVIVNDATFRLVNDNLQEAISGLDYDIIKVRQQNKPNPSQ